MLANLVAAIGHRAFYKSNPARGDDDVLAWAVRTLTYASLADPQTYPSPALITACSTFVVAQADK